MMNICKIKPIEFSVCDDGLTLPGRVEQVTITKRQAEKLKANGHVVIQRYGTKIKVQYHDIK